jgi:hypothetical protein
MTGPLSKWFKLPTLTERLRAANVREDLIQAADRTAFGRQTDREIPALGGLLTEAEGVIALVEGRLGGAIGLLMLTSRRLVFAPKAADRAAVSTVDLDDVMSVRWRMRRGLGVLDVTTRSGDLIVDQILGNQAERLTTSIQQAMSPPPDGPSSHRDPLEELAELRALHRAGAIGDAEFQTRKQQLFGQI